MLGASEQNTKTQKRKGRPTEHLALEEFDTVDIVVAENLIRRIQ